MSVLEGKASLRNLKLKPDVLEPLQLPVVVKEGFLGKVDIEIPWTKLKQESAILRVGDIFILAGPSVLHEEVTLLDN